MKSYQLADDPKLPLPGDTSHDDAAAALARFIGKPWMAQRFRNNLAIGDETDTGNIIHEHLRGK